LDSPYSESRGSPAHRERRIDLCGFSRSASREKPDAGEAGAAFTARMALTATARSIPGTLRQAVVVRGRFAIATDEPASLGGEDTGPAPHELLPAALASCVSTTLLMYARTKGWDLGRVEVEVEYEQRPPRRCEIAVHVERPLTSEQIARLEKVAASCPVRRAIEGGIAFHERLDAAARTAEAA
jgi:putative redox protein